MRFSIQLSGIKEALEVYDHKRVMRAARATLNRVAKSGKTEASKLIRAAWNIKKADLDRKIAVKGAITGNLQASLTITSEPINLLYFGAVQNTGAQKISLRRKYKGRISPEDVLKRTKTAGTGGSGVTAQIRRGRRVVLPNAFIFRGTGGTPLVFIRSKKVKSTMPGKKGLKAIKIITKPSMFQQRNALHPTIAKIEERWNKEWEHQITQLTKKGSWLDKR